MAKNPEDRFATTSAFVAALAGESAVGTAPHTAPHKAPRPAVKPSAPAANVPHRGRQWIGNALAAVMVLTAAAVGINAWRSSQRSVTPPPSTADTLAERLARELEETRKIALDAQRRAERAEAMQRPVAPPVAAPTPAPTGHVSVMVRGGAPRLLIDGKEGAVSTPAILEVPLGRHIIRVEEAGRQYQPAQYVIDVGAGDTSRLVFSDARANARGVAPNFAPSGGDAAEMDPASVGAGTDAGVRPFLLPTRIWQNMSPQEQAMLRSRWTRMSPEQRQRALKDMQVRDSSRAPFPRRVAPPRPPQP
jgi:hypothetical protein